MPEYTCASVVVLRICKFRRCIASELKLVKKVFPLHLMKEVSACCGTTRRICQDTFHAPIDGKPTADSNTLKLEIFHGAAECAAMCVLCTLIAASYDGRLVSPRCTLVLLLSTFLFPMNTALRDEGVWLPFGYTRIALRPGLLSDPCSPCHFLDLNSARGSLRCRSFVRFIGI